MANEIEKKFFDTFGIKPRVCIKSCDKCQHYSYDYCYSGYCTLGSDYDNCGVAIKQYPQITDHILLELICIHNTYFKTNLYSLDYESLRKEVLKDLINEQELRELKNDYVSDDMKQQVRTLFEKE